VKIWHGGNNFNDFPENQLIKFRALILPYFFFLHSFSLHLFVSQKSLNDEERGGNCLLVPERSYGPDNGCKTE